jgi:hypothetical protein
MGRGTSGDLVCDCTIVCLCMWTDIMYVSCMMLGLGWSRPIHAMFDVGMFGGLETLSGILRHG